MTLALLGTDYKRSSLKEIESIYLNVEKRTQFYTELNHCEWVDEAVLLFTCNRAELYFYTEHLDQAIHWIENFWIRNNHISRESIQKIVKLTVGKDVQEHIAHVASGMRSMVFGENEILAQVKDAYHAAQENGATQSKSNKFFQSIIAIGKRARSETEISKGAYSITSIAIDGMNAIMKEDRDQRILIVGGGTMGLRAIKKLTAQGYTNVYITNRTEDKLLRICEKYQIQRIPFSEIRAHYKTFDTVFFATSSETYLMSQTDMSEQASRPKVIIDVGLPRNVDPDIESLDHIQYLGLNMLESIANNNINTRKKEFPKIEAIIEEELKEFEKWTQYSRLATVA